MSKEKYIYAIFIFLFLTASCCLLNPLAVVFFICYYCFDVTEYWVVCFRTHTDSDPTDKICKLGEDSFPTANRHLPSDPNWNSGSIVLSTMLHWQRGTDRSNNPGVCKSKELRRIYICWLSVCEVNDWIKNVQERSTRVQNHCGSQKYTLSWCSMFSFTSIDYRPIFDYLSQAGLETVSLSIDLE